MDTNGTYPWNLLQHLTFTFLFLSPPPPRPTPWWPSLWLMLNEWLDQPHIHKLGGGQGWTSSKIYWSRPFISSKRSILQSLKILRGGLGIIVQFWIKPSGSTTAIPLNNSLVPVNVPTETCQYHLSRDIFWPTSIPWTHWFFHRCTVTAFLNNPPCRFRPLLLHFLAHLYYQTCWWPITEFMTTKIWQFHTCKLHCTSFLEHQSWYRWRQLPGCRRTPCSDKVGDMLGTSLWKERDGIIYQAQEGGYIIRGGR